MSPLVYAVSLLNMTLVFDVKTLSAMMHLTLILPSALID
ncbi:hypothetical protein PRUB_b0799 [Pseudoalteromonas rubra]|uniref:Uncharacterized protein n=1 Tax=Pseudoalteromonas rubra TaxID=43658 RepID=A0A8T0C0C7_9GAMM|nr:hypothetical protein PRUB_b0799 [Pseudoalteromonas rubra]